MVLRHFLCPNSSRSSNQLLRLFSISCFITLKFEKRSPEARSPSESRSAMSSSFFGFAENDKPESGDGATWLKMQEAVGRANQSFKEAVARLKESNKRMWEDMEQHIEHARQTIETSLSSTVDMSNLMRQNVHLGWDGFVTAAVSASPYVDDDVTTTPHDHVEMPTTTAAPLTTTTQAASTTEDHTYFTRLGDDDDDVGGDVRAITTSSHDEEMPRAPRTIPPECYMTVPEIIEHSGYDSETHVAETRDGYLLTVHRIPRRKGESASSTNQQEQPRPTVLLQHGVLADASCWLLNGADNSPAFILANAGFDVWLGNVRGSTYSRKHRLLNADQDDEFWNFTWQDMAEYDLPSMVDLALRKSGNEKLYYIGHSQGTLIGFAGLSEQAELKERIAAFFALAPVVTLKHIKSPLRSLTPIAKLVGTGLSLFGGTEILPKKKITQWIFAKLHRHHKKNFLESQLSYHGSNLMMFLCGVHMDHYYPDRIPVYFTHTPAGTSLHNLVHLSQLVDSGKTQKFDFASSKKNIAAYGQETPPEYDVSSITTPTALFVGTMDKFADVKDCSTLSEKLKNCLIHNETIEDFDHLDFLWGRTAHEKVYTDVIRLINEREGKELNSIAND